MCRRNTESQVELYVQCSVADMSPDARIRGATAGKTTCRFHTVPVWIRTVRSLQKSSACRQLQSTLPPRPSVSAALAKSSTGMKSAAVVQPIESLDSSLERPLSVGLSTQLTSFIGREDELSWIAKRLEAGQRLLTITGPGGVGKTRLALAAASLLNARSTFDDGVVVVALAQVADESLVVPTIARALDVVVEDGRQPVHRLEALQGRKLLLVLDNLEHVVGAAIELHQLLDELPDLSLLVTSRRALRVSGEQEFALSPLAVPESGSSAALDQLLQFPSIALFVDRAAASNPQFSLTEVNASAVVTICTRLDGLPLAIELAAARIRMLSPQALASRLSGRLQLLTAGPRDAPRRQQTLRETISWSFELLTEEERLLFRLISVFSGGASLEAVEAVVLRAAPQLAPDTLAGVAALVDHSLLVKEAEAAGESRFRMLETIREFGLDELEASGAASSARDAHAEYFVEQAERSAEGEYGALESSLLRKLEPDLGNVRAALTWLLAQQPFDSPRANLGLRLAGAMVRFWDVRGYLQEEYDWLTRALSMVKAGPTRERATALTALGVNCWFTNQLDDAIKWQQEALTIWRMLNDPSAIVRSLWFLGLVAGKRREVQRLDELYEESAPLAPHLGITLWTVVPNSLQALKALAERDGQRCRDTLAATLDYHVKHGYLWPHAWCLGIMAEAAMIDGNRDESLSLYQRSLAEFNEHGDIYATIDCLVAIANHASGYGQPETAAMLLSVVRQIRFAVGYRMTWATISEQDSWNLTNSLLDSDRVGQIQADALDLRLSDAVALALSVKPEQVGHAPALKQGNRYGLTSREREVLKLLAEGRSNQEIGDLLFISARTAGTHVANILQKLGVHSRAAAVAVALNKDLDLES